MTEQDDDPGIYNHDRDTRDLCPISDSARAESALRSLEILGAEQGIYTIKHDDGLTEVVVLDKRGDGVFSAFGEDLYFGICNAACVAGLERDPLVKPLTRPDLSGVSPRDHAAALGAIAKALDMPGATVPEMVAAIEKLRAAHLEPK